MVNNTLKINKRKLSLKEKILKYLIEHKFPMSIMEISHQLNTDYKNTFNAVNDLSSINKKKIGNINLIEVKLVPHQEIYSVENKRTEQFLQENKSLNLLTKDIESIAYPFMIVLIFGSYAKKLQTKISDIDICIISDNLSKVKELTSRLKLLPLNLELHTSEVEEFESMLDTVKENVAKEIVKNNVILYGINNYYNLISKWTKKE